MSKVSKKIVRGDFNDLRAVVHYTKAAHRIGLWESERILIERFFPNKSAQLLEAGCGAGRVAVALWEAGYHDIHAFDFAEELLAQAQSLAMEKEADVGFFHADATQLEKCKILEDAHFDGVLFMFNGLMQIPLRRNRRRALRALHHFCRLGAPLMFTTHDREDSKEEQVIWRLEAMRWAKGKEDPILREFGDRYYEDKEIGRTSMHLPERGEILEDLKATGWNHTFDTMRRNVAREPRKVRDFSDECRFWVATKA